MRPSRQDGYFLTEILLTLTILTVGILGFLSAFQSNYRSAIDAMADDWAQTALDNVAGTLKTSIFDKLYATYQDDTIMVTDVEGYGGKPMQVTIHFDVNETTLSSAYGPVGDIDGDGAKSTVNASTTYRLLPTRLSVTYGTSHGTATKTMYLILASP